MSAKKVALVGAAGLLLASASTAFADRPHWKHGYYGHAKHVRPVVVVHDVPRHFAPRVFVPAPVVVARPVVVAAPVVIAPPVRYRALHYAPPAFPVVYAAGPGIATVGGAVAGALIGNHIGHGGDRFATTAIGAALGAFVGSQFEYGY